MLKRLGKYEIIGEIGRGAMGEVYKAHDPFIGRMVALKTITGTLISNPQLLERFYQEARSAGTLQHPNIVTVYELGRERDTPFIAMEFIEGETLENIIESHRPLKITEKVGMIVQVARALEYAHKRGVVHRDIKPGNVMVTKDGDVKVVDFGIARLMDAAKTETNVLLGTLAYMSPQQIRGEKADERSDIWSLGVMFYELLSYSRAFQGDNHAALMLNIVDERQTTSPLSQFIPDCPAALQALVGRMMERRLDQRFQSMDEVLYQLEPLWRELREASVSELIASSERLIGAKDFAQARDLLRHALDIDPRNERIKTLLDIIAAELKKIQIQEQVKSHTVRARNLLNEGKHQQALAATDAALKLDSTAETARNLLSEIEHAIAAARQIEDGLQAGKQRFAENDLPTALDAIQKVLVLDPANIQALAMQKQITTLIQQREQQAKLAEILQRARQFWAQQKFSDCIDFLTDARKQFPSDPEISKLLETARLERAERLKQAKLSESRSLIASQRVDEAIALLEDLLKTHPGDFAVQSLLDVAFKERSDLRRKETLRNELAALRAMISDKKFVEAVSRGQRLSREFPADTDVRELLGFAQEELAQLERKRNIEEEWQTARKRIEAGKFKDAVAAAEKALARFPGESALQSILDEAREKQKEYEKRELFLRRISEIRGKINKGQHTDAVDLARQTLATLGSNNEVSQLLRAAEVELAEKRRKKEEQEKEFLAAQTSLDEGHFDDATRILQAGIETQIFSKKDPRVRQLFGQIKQRMATRPRAAVSNPAEAANSRPVSDPLSSGLPQTSTAVGVLSATAQVRARQSGTISEKQASAEVASPDTVPSELGIVATCNHWIAGMRKQPLLLGAAAVLLLAIIAVVFYSFSGPSKQQIALRDSAVLLEQQGHWPEALSKFQSLSAGNSALAKEAQRHAAGLRTRLDAEESLIQQAQQERAKSNIDDARRHFQQVADMHGDQEEFAREAIYNLPVPPVEKPAAPGRKTPEKPKPQPKPSIDQNSPSSPPPPCFLLPADIANTLDRADRNRANGQYTDAEREYKDVLNCNPENERALNGLAKTIEDKALPK